MSEHDDQIYLQHIFKAIERIELYLKNTNEEKFFKSYLTQDGAIRQLEIIGEASKNLSRQFRMLTLYIPWDDIIGMRDKLIHHYFGVDLRIVWKTITENIPQLKKDLLDIVEKT